MLTARSQTERRRRKQQGFTLVELLVVLAILGLLAAIAVPQAIKYLGGARVSTAEVQIDSLSTALDLFKLDVGRYPTTEEGLQALVTAPAAVKGWSGPYVKKKESLTDPWDRPYRYRSPGEHGEYDLYSLGPNGDAGDPSEAITSW